MCSIKLQKKGSESTIKHYKRNRTETLSLRLTKTEKRQLKALASKQDLSLTDYILLSALRYSKAEPYRPLLQSLDSLRTQLLTLRETQNTDEIADALVKQSKIYDEVLAAIRCR